MNGVALRVVQPDATPEEIAAIVAALTSVVTPSAPVDIDSPRGELSEWVRSARLESRRVVPQRGSWRLSDRMPRR